MDNPWITLPESFVLPEDQETLHDNKRKFQHQLPPVPFLNDPRKAQIIILAKNPAYADTNDKNLEDFPDLVPQNIAALTFNSDCPFFYLDEKFKGSDGYEWWNKVLREVFEASHKKCGLSREAVIHKLSCVQWFPYHSKTFSKVPKKWKLLHSQHYSFDLVKEAAAMPNKLFVILWGTVNECLWRENVPNLPKDCIILDNARCPCLSPNNMKQNFSRLIDTICTP